ncbi:MAG: MarR family winged helix-turn-helix transcriptional regulator [Solirubrobacteraceae bacterium]
MQPSRTDVQRMVAALFAMNAGLDRARRRSRGASTLSLLQLLAGGVGLRPSDLAEHLGVHPSLITRQIQELEDAGFVRVSANPDDARSLLVSLTPAGVAEQRCLREVGLDRFARFVAAWTPEEVRTLADLLEKLEQSKAAVAAQERLRAAPPRPQATRRRRRRTSAID